MEIIEAQQKVDELIKNYGGYWTELSMLAHLTEETGELSKAMNIKFGQKKKKHENDGGQIPEELADVLFTTLAIANQLNINLDNEFSIKIKKDWEKCKGVYG